MNIGSPPHGTGAPCPLGKSLIEAKMQESVSTSFMANDMTQFMKKMGVIPNEEE
jgi:hypothetical protein